MDRQSHWNGVYESRRPDEVSWYQRNPERSIGIIRKCTDPTQRVIDIGAGTSRLIDALLDIGYNRPIALDVSAIGLGCSKSRLGPLAGRVHWIVADITQSPVLPAVDLWHDRATFHFLTNAHEQSSYANLAARTVRPSGYLVIATFALDGPDMCSGLRVQQHDGLSLCKLFGGDFEHTYDEHETHQTPSGKEQRFSWSVFRRRAGELRRHRPSSIPAPLSSQPDQLA